MNEKIGSPIVTKVAVSTAGLYNTSKRLIMRRLPTPTHWKYVTKVIPTRLCWSGCDRTPHRTGATMYYTTVCSLFQPTGFFLSQSPLEFFIYQKICWKYKTNLPSTTRDGQTEWLSFSVPRFLPRQFLNRFSIPRNVPRKKFSVPRKFRGIPFSAEFLIFRGKFRVPRKFHIPRNIHFPRKFRNFSVKHLFFQFFFFNLKMYNYKEKNYEKIGGCARVRSVLFAHVDFGRSWPK